MAAPPAAAAAAAAATGGGLPPVFPLLGAASFCTFSTRYAMAPLVSVFIAAQEGFSTAEKTYLLSAFFPGCTCLREAALCTYPCWLS